MRPLVFNICLALMTWFAWHTLAGGPAAFATLLANWQITATMVFGSFIAGAWLLAPQLPPAVIKRS